MHIKHADQTRCVHVRSSTCVLLGGVGGRGGTLHYYEGPARTVWFWWQMWVQPLTKFISCHKYQRPVFAIVTNALKNNALKCTHNYKHKLFLTFKESATYWLRPITCFTCFISYTDVCITYSLYSFIFVKFCPTYLSFSTTYAVWTRHTGITGAQFKYWISPRDVHRTINRREKPTSILYLHNKALYKSFVF
jgi:hypothetical protein